MSIESNSIVTPIKLQKLTNLNNLLYTTKRTPICIKDVIPSPKRQTKLSLHFKSSRKAKSSSRSRTIDSNSKYLPSFLFDFLDEERPKMTRTLKEPVKLQEPKYLNLRKKEKRENPLSETQTEKFPDLSVHRFWERSQIQSTEVKNRPVSTFYKPYVIEISPRASITLYGIEPINKPFSLTGTGDKRNKNSKSINIRNLSADKPNKPELTLKPIIIETPSRTFAETLQRVQDIAKQTEEAFNAYNSNI